MNLQGYGERPPSGHDVGLSVKLFTPGTDVWSRTPTADYIYVPGGDNNTIANIDANVNTHAMSFDIVGAIPGTYDITIASNHTLMNVKRAVPVELPETTVNFGTQLEGNTNNDRQVNALDFSLLATSYGKSTGDIGFDQSADFNESGQVNALDFSLLTASYFKYWEPVELG